MDGITIVAGILVVPMLAYSVFMLYAINNLEKRQVL